MHIPDHFLNPSVALSCGILSLGALGYACFRAQRVLPAHHVPLLGLSAAFVFAAQIVNFPVASGVSGHLLGAAMVAVLLGPSAAMVALAAVLTLQCFLFADGGVSALGANLLNMAILAPLAGYGIWRLFTRLLPTRAGQLASAAAAAWFSTVLASAACAGQLALSGKVSAGLVFPAMLGVHALIGLGEAAITALVLSAIWKARPELLRPQASFSRRDLAPLLGYGLVCSAALALFVSPFACSWPDGLEHVARHLGFAVEPGRPILPSLLPDYHVPGVSNQILSTGLAGLLGVALLFCAAWATAKLLPRTPATAEPKPIPAPRGAVRK